MSFLGPMFLFALGLRVRLGVPDHAASFAPGLAGLFGGSWPPAWIVIFSSKTVISCWASASPQLAP